jgi:hypothetical protein
MSSKCVNCELVLSETIDLNTQLNKHKTIVENLSKELQNSRFKQLEFKLRNEKLLKDFLFEIKNFFNETSFNSSTLPPTTATSKTLSSSFSSSSNTSSSYLSSVSSNFGPFNSSVNSLNSLIDILYKNYKNLYGLNLVNLNYNENELIFMNGFEKNLDQTVEKAKAKLITILSSLKKLDQSTSDSQSSLTLFTIKIEHDLNEFKTRTQLLKEKLEEQKQILNSLTNSGFKLDTSNMTNVTPLDSLLIPNESSSIIMPPQPNLNQALSTNSSTSSYSSSSLFTSSLPSTLYQYMNKENDRVYTCPKCGIGIESTRVMHKKYETHVRLCDSRLNKACIFCFKLFNLGEQNAFEEHVQKHMSHKEKKRQLLTISPTTTVSTNSKDENNNNRVISNSPTQNSNTATTSSISGVGSSGSNSVGDQLAITRNNRLDVFINRDDSF